MEIFVLPILLKIKKSLYFKFSVSLGYTKGLVKLCWRLQILKTYRTFLWSPRIRLNWLTRQLGFLPRGWTGMKHLETTTVSIYMLPICFPASNTKIDVQTVFPRLLTKSDGKTDCFHVYFCPYSYCNKTCAKEHKSHYNREWLKNANKPR